MALSGNNNNRKKAKMRNEFTGIGRLGKDPYIKEFGNGGELARFTIACEERWWDQNAGEWKKKTEWIPCIAWRKQAEKVRKLAIKGSTLFVSGRFTTSSWENSNGERQYKSEITADQVFVLDGQKKKKTSTPRDFDGKSDFDSRSDEEFENSNPSSSGFGESSDFSSSEEEDGDIPF